jgi:hypothetical protein
MVVRAEEWESFGLWASAALAQAIKDSIFPANIDPSIPPKEAICKSRERPVGTTAFRNRLALRALVRKSALSMKISALHVGMNVRHPQYGLGVVKTIGEHTAEVLFPEGRKTVEPDSSGVEPAEAHASVSGLEIPLRSLIDQVVSSAIKELGLERDDSIVEGLGARWHGGRMVMHPADPTLQTKEVPMEVFFHKIVMMRNNFRVLEQKINAHEKLTDGEKVDMQQYISRCYGSMTTFNLLFKNKEEQFGG